MEYTNYIRRPATCVQFFKKDWTMHKDILPNPAKDGQFLLPITTGLLKGAVLVVTDSNWIIVEGERTIIMSDELFNLTFCKPFVL